MKRRRLVQLVCIMFLLFTAIFSYRLWNSRQHLTREVELHLGTVCEIQIVGHRARAHALIADCFSLVEMYEQKLSIYRNDSEIAALNAAKAGVPVAISAETYTMLKASEHFSKLSDGLFDITLYPVLALWGFYDSRAGTFDARELAAARALVNYRFVTFRKKRDTYIAEKRYDGVKVDLGGIAKGYIADRVAGLLRQNSVRNFLVNIGGNIYADGRYIHGNGWRVGVRDPRNETGLMSSLVLHNTAVSTSGDYERFIIKNGVKYGHIINPKTGNPVLGVAAVTVVADDAMTADAASTILFLSEKRKRNTYFDRLGLRYALFVDYKDETYTVTELGAVPQG